MGQPQLRVLPELLTESVDSGDFAPGDLGGIYEVITGEKYRLGTIHDPNTVSRTADSCLTYVPASTGYEVTADLSEGAAGLRAGVLHSANRDGVAFTPLDNDFVWFQVHGVRTSAYNPTSDTAIAAGEAVVIDADGVCDREAAASNDVFGYCETARSGLSTGVETTVEIFIDAIMS